MIPFLRCGHCQKPIAARWTRCPFCKRPSYAPRHSRYPFIDRRLDGFRVFSAGAAVWWVGAAFFLAYGADRPWTGALLGAVGAVALASSIALPLTSLAWRLTEVQWAATFLLLGGLLFQQGWVVLVALLPLAVVAWMLLSRRDALARLEGREPPAVKQDESRVPKWTPCVICGSRDSTVVAPLYVVSFITVSFRFPGEFRSLCLGHAKSNALWAVFISAVIGPIGLPWGFLWAFDAVQLNWDQGGVHLDSDVLAEMRRRETEQTDVEETGRGFELLGGLICAGVILFVAAWRLPAVLGF